MGFFVYLKSNSVSLSKSENAVLHGEVSGEESKQEEQKPLVPPAPESPPPGENAVKFPGTKHGGEPMVHAGSRPTPLAGGPPIGAGAKPVVHAGGAPRFRQGQDSISPITAQNTKLAEKNEFGEGATFGYGTTSYEAQHGSKDDQFSKLTIGGMKRSLSFDSSSCFGVIIKSDKPVTPKQTVSGISFRIENPVGSVRRGENSYGIKWKTVMSADYGYILGVPGVDGDSLDVFLGPEVRKIKNSKGKEGFFDKVWIIHSQNPETKQYDEDKVMFGYQSKESAVTSFRRHYDKPDDYLGPISEYSLSEFKKIIDKIKRTKTPQRIGVGRNIIPKKRRS